MILLVLIHLVLLITGIMLVWRMKSRPALRNSLLILFAILFLLGVLWDFILVRNAWIDRGARTFIKNIINNAPNNVSIPYSSAITSEDVKKEIQTALNSVPRCDYKLELQTIFPGGDFFLYDVSFENGQACVMMIDVRGEQYTIYRMTKP
ncbi:MAG TPA: hypothetical protein PKY88_13015 [Anaerohalosphaeraceae bacterium]|nr:hypothetical protein [Anaerohalosphaeraceae bacterium]